MPPSLSHIRTVVTAYLDRHPGERDALAGLLAALDADAEPTNRTTLPAHITCSAVVIDRHRRVLHIRHKASGGLLLAPGGHVETDDDTLLAAALREVKEETGIPASALVLTSELRDEPIDIDVHIIDPNPARGEAAHWHYDVRFVFYLTDGAPELTLQAEEVTGSAWQPFDEVSSPTLREKLAGSALDGVIVPVNASAIIHDGNGRYLLHLRDADKPWIWEPGCWSLLGGGREPQDRTLLDTVCRELREEAGLTVAGLEPYVVEHVTGTDGTRVPIQLFTGLWNGDPARLPLTEGVMLAWVRPEKFPHMTMLPSTRELLEQHAVDHPLPADGPTAPAGTARAEAPSGTVLNVVGVHLYLERDGQVLLGLRHPDSAYAGGSWHVLAGHCEAEAASACLVREAYEEAGLVIESADVELVHTVHMREQPTDPPRVQLFFRALRWEGGPKLREPDRCVQWEWWNVKDLPEPIVPYTRAAIEGIRAGRVYTELGWTR
ncbi:NUDIX domain-containing protein [Streptomyces sp. NBC_00094]|uniref:NUDIX domain-containing protein n=1 Tax=Streptomyces sp. NBC_00094 TaxID=2903620 RepID=UPI0022514BC6|nr:NUDIX domain-containing protein [Streptomyces sp. NBC_00094]MCX5395327.1 NUDIX domain-containing protein [Streptomyces sp. NBC_00094]